MHSCSNSHWPKWHPYETQWNLIREQQSRRGDKLELFLCKCYLFFRYFLLNILNTFLCIRKSNQIRDLGILSGSMLCFLYTFRFVYIAYMYMLLPSLKHQLSTLKIKCRVNSAYILYIQPVSSAYLLTGCCTPFVSFHLDAGAWTWL